MSSTPKPPSRPPAGTESSSPKIFSHDKPARLAMYAFIFSGASKLLTSGALWMTVLGTACGVVALVFAVMALVGIGRSRRRTAVIVSVVAAVILTGFSLLTGGIRLAFWDPVSEHEQCVADSVTISGEAACQKNLEEKLRESLLPISR